MKLELSEQIFEKYTNIKFHEIRPVGAELFHADGRSNVTKFSNAPMSRTVFYTYFVGQLV